MREHVTKPVQTNRQTSPHPPTCPCLHSKRIIAAWLKAAQRTRTLRVIFKVLYEGLVTGAGRTILPSPEDSPTTPDVFSKVCKTEPT